MAMISAIYRQKKRFKAYIVGIGAWESCFGVRMLRKVGALCGRDGRAERINSGAELELWLGSPSYLE